MTESTLTEKPAMLTPGPWRFEVRNCAPDGAVPVWVGYIYGRHPDQVCEVEVAVLYGVDEHLEPDGRRLAAAPELLAALKALVAAVERDDNPRDEGHSSTSDEMRAATTAIAKAEGR